MDWSGSSSDGSSWAQRTLDYDWEDMIFLSGGGSSREGLIDLPAAYAADLYLNGEKTAELTGGSLEDGKLRLYYDQDWQKVGSCGTGVEMLFLLELIPETGADFAAARLEISGPVAAGDLTADALPEGECILSWNIAALEVAS